MILLIVGILNNCRHNQAWKHFSSKQSSLDVDCHFAAWASAFDEVLPVHALNAQRCGDHAFVFVHYRIRNCKPKIQEPAILLGLGTLCNYLVIAANSFRMPISVKALSVYSTMTPEAVIAQRADYFVATDGANFLFLGDIIYMPINVLGGFMSVGDILLAAGMFLLIVQVMVKTVFPPKNL